MRLKNMNKQGVKNPYITEFNELLISEKSTNELVDAYISALKEDKECPDEDIEFLFYMAISENVDYAISRIPELIKNSKSWARCFYNLHTSERIHLPATVRAKECLLDLYRKLKFDLDDTLGEAYSPIAAVCILGDIDTLTLFAENGVDLTRRSATSHWTPLHYACAHARSNVVQFLVAQKVPLCVYDKNGFSPLSMILKYNTTDEIQKEFLEPLLLNGASIFEPFLGDPSGVRYYSRKLRLCQFEPRFLIGTVFYEPHGVFGNLSQDFPEIFSLRCRELIQYAPVQRKFPALHALVMSGFARLSEMALYKIYEKNLIENSVSVMPFLNHEISVIPELKKLEARVKLLQQNMEFTLNEFGQRDEKDSKKFAVGAFCVGLAYFMLGPSWPFNIFRYFSAIFAVLCVFVRFTEYKPKPNHIVKHGKYYPLAECLWWPEARNQLELIKKVLLEENIPGSEAPLTQLEELMTEVPLFEGKTNKVHFGKLYKFFSNLVIFYQEYSKTLANSLQRRKEPLSSSAFLWSRIQAPDLNLEPQQTDPDALSLKIKCE